MADVTVLTERQRTMIAFAVRLFMADAHNRAQAAGQDREGRYFQPGAVTAFLIDAAEAEELLTLMRNGPLLVPAHGVEGKTE